VTGELVRATAPTMVEDDEISLIALATTLVRNRWRIVRWTIAGVGLAVMTVWGKPLMYMASASFLPEDAGSKSSGLASIAGQFGVSVPGANPGQSSLFYASLTRSRVLLEGIARDTFTVQELGARRVALLDLFAIPKGSDKVREEQAVALLRGIVASSVDENTGLVEVTVTTQWPSVSLGIAGALVDGIEQYHRRTKQTEAAMERKFIGQRVTLAHSDLRNAEDRLSEFQNANRAIDGSAQLGFQRDRLRRDITLAQELYTTLDRSYQDALIRELREAPAAMIIDPPSVGSTPLPRGRLTRLLLGFLLGSFMGALVGFAAEAMDRRRAAADPETAALFGAVRDVRQDIIRPLRWLTKKPARPDAPG
jgi:uncharacterized protein involved in exopolysaccharide biosynthesis